MNATRDLQGVSLEACSIRKLFEVLEAQARLLFWECPAE